jgi:hypothetical protein
LNPQLERQTLVFVLRVWREYLACDVPSLRGEIEDLARHEKHLFSSIQELERLLQSCCKADKPVEKPESNQTPG